MSEKGKQSKKVGNESIPLEKGYLYYVGKDGYPWASPMTHNKLGKKKKVGTEKIEKKDGFFYYRGKDGYVYEAPQKRLVKGKGYVNVADIKK